MKKHLGAEHKIRGTVRYAAIFTAGALCYGSMEILWRGYTHYSMLIAGGTVLCGAYIINRRNKGCHLLLRAVAVALFTVTVELLFGVVFNMLLKQSVWDYSDRPLNYFGQICLSYSLLWLIISVALCLFLERGIPLLCQLIRKRSCRSAKLT